MAKKNTEYELAIKIAGEIEKSFYETTRLTKKELSNMVKDAAAASAIAASVPASFREEMAKMGDSLKQSEPFFDGMEKVAVRSFQAIATAATAASAGILAISRECINVGSEFESAFAGVKKTVDASDIELLQMQNDIREMAKTMPLTAAELSGIAEAAGQLGIEVPNIAEFTETMANLAAATNLNSEEGAAQFAQFANIVQMSQENFDNLGSVVVALGNNMATTEADITALGMRIAAAGSQVNLSEADIMAYSAALSSVGIEAEAGGTAFSKMLVNLQLATETGKNLKSYAQVAGMTGQEFKKAFQDDATTAINAFLTGLNDTERNGKSAIAVLTDMGINEARMRDMMIRAGNASGMFADALTLSNTAWEENTALANEAAQRYATFESQSDILKNKVTDIGISLYDDMRPGLMELLGLGNEVIDAMAENVETAGIVLDNFGGSIPTMAREAKKAGQAMGEFVQPFLKMGGWLVDNPGVITGTIAAVGTSLATYKVATGVASLAKAFGNLYGAGLPILALGGVAGIIKGISTQVKKSAEEAKRANLDQHFGNISLSLAELQETAAQIVKTESLEQANEAIAALGDVDMISDQIQTAIQAMNKMDWKVSVGLELTEEERGEYIAQAQKYVQEMQEYLEQNQYALNLSVRALLPDDMENNNLITQLNDFYGDKQQELADLGMKLNETVTEAMNDGFLDIDEVEAIGNLKREMAEIQAAVAGNDFESGLDLLKMQYGGTLDADSVINLQAEIRKQQEAALEAYNEAYVKAMSGNRGMLASGEISQDEYDANIKSLNEGYIQNKAGIQAKAALFETEMITGAYADEMPDMTNMLQGYVTQELEDILKDVALSGTYNHLDWIAEYVNNDLAGGISSDTRNAMAELYEELAPQMAQMQELAQQFRDAEKEIPEEVQKSLEQFAKIGAIGGNLDAIWELVRKESASPAYQKALEAFVEDGGYIPEALAQGMVDNQYLMNDTAREIIADTQKAINSGDLGTLLIPMEYSVPGLPQMAKAEIVSAGHKDGGIFTKPHVAWFAEAGPEAAIPLNGSQNAIDLWLKTGELLRMKGLEGDSGSVEERLNNIIYNNTEGARIEYSPTLQFYGESPSKDEIQEAMDEEQEKFARMMEQYLKNQGRFNFY